MKGSQVLKATIRLIVIGLIALSAPFAATAAASASASHPVCSGYYCHGHDPMIYACTVSASAGYSDSLATLWNRYSANCNSNWGRAQLSSSALQAGDSIRVSISTDDSKGNNEFYCAPGLSNSGYLTEYCTAWYAGPDIIFSDMTDGTNVTFAAAYVYNSTGQQIDLLEVTL